MDIKIGDTWQGLSPILISVVRADVALRLLYAVKNRSAEDLAAWVSQIAPAEYTPAGFSIDDADLLVKDKEKIAGLADISIRLDSHKIGDLVYAAAAAEALDPARVLVEEVYELSVFGDIAMVARLRVPVPSAGPRSRLEVQSAYIDLTGSAQTVEMRPAVRQRDFEDTWAEVELEHRARIWYLAASQALAQRARTSGQLVLFPRLGGEFLDAPAVIIKPDAAKVSLPPVSTRATDHEFFAFPEIEGKLFMLRLVVPPSPELDGNGNPVLPGWPQNYRFHVETGEILLFGPSYPSGIEVRLGGGDVAWSHSGELLSPARSRNIGDALQSALDALMSSGAASDQPLELAITATAQRPGNIHLELDGEVHAIVERFAGGQTKHVIAFDHSVHEAEMPLQIPMIGEAVAASMIVAGRLSNSVIEHELGADDPATGDNKIGVRLIENVIYSQSFQVNTAFALSAVDVRLAQASAGAILSLAVTAGEVTASAELKIPAGGRHGRWYTLRLDTALELEPETTYTARAWVRGGSVAWLCGAGGERHHLLRHEGAAPASRVVDVNDHNPLLGQLRLRSNVPMDEPNLDIRLTPGNHQIPLEEMEVSEDGWFQARANLLQGLRALSGSEATLHVQARSEGELTLRDPQIRYRFHLVSS